MLCLESSKSEDSFVWLSSKRSSEETEKRKRQDEFKLIQMASIVGGAVASWIVRSSLDREVWIRTLARDTVLCSWARNFTFYSLSLRSAE